MSACRKTRLAGLAASTGRLLSSSARRPPPPWIDHPPTAPCPTRGAAPIPDDGLTPDLDRTTVCKEGELPITQAWSTPYPRCRSRTRASGPTPCESTSSAQVTLMGRIYSQASQVSVWLGPWLIPRRRTSISSVTLRVPCPMRCIASAGCSRGRVSRTAASGAR